MNKRDPFMDNRFGNFGFSYKKRADGSVEIYQYGKIATTLTGAKAFEFLDNIDTSSFADDQLYMAKVSGRPAVERAPKKDPFEKFKKRPR